MNYSEGGLSASDVALLSNSGRTNDTGWGNEGGAWWIIIFLIFAFLGWGRNGNGFGGGSSGAADNYVLASDFATLQRQIDSATSTLERKADITQQGICDGFYAMNTGILNGFGNVQQSLCQGFSGVNNSIMTNGYETRLGIQNIGSQLASCCCDIREGIQGINYNMAQNACALQNTMNTNTRDVIDSVNANYRALHDEIIANRIEDKNAQIAAQQNEINALRLAASQERQNNYLVNELKPCPIPAYITCNPYQSAYGTCNNGCNCGNF